MKLAFDDPLPHQLPETLGTYSLARALRRAIDGKPVDGLEGEVSAEIRNRTGKVPEGFLLPLDAPARRSLTTTTGAGSVPTILGSTIDILRAKIATAILGATVLPDLTGGLLALPVRTQTATVTWGAEATPPSESDQTTAQVLLTPHQISAFTDVSRKSFDRIPNVTDLVIEDLTRGIAVEIDRVAINGTGLPSQPLGILQNTAIAQVPAGTNGAAPTRALLASLVEQVGIGNADIVGGRMGFLTSPQGKYKLEITDKSATVSTGRYLWDDGNMVCGEPAVSSTQVPANLTKGSGTSLTAVIFGEWSSLMIGMWGAVDIIVNPYLQSSNGIVRITAIQDIDVQPRFAASFAVMPDMLSS